MAGGWQNQCASTFGGFNFMELGSNDRVIVNPLRIKKSVTVELEPALVWCAQRPSATFMGVHVARLQFPENCVATVGLDRRHPGIPDDLRRRAAIMPRRLKGASVMYSIVSRRRSDRPRLVILATVHLADPHDHRPCQSPSFRCSAELSAPDAFDFKRDHAALSTLDH